ncbi:TAT-variant-translocated molybdopterin oxidoreductase [Emticicia sp. 17c]|uniref:TAT-variant-translocated molybdopterin oxidoreductase n=1 Tax=Emticicia sp. 17c TaxID=3127704 RepID=UPI00301C159B
MENTNKRYWKGVEELKNDIEFVKNANREFNLDDIDTVEPTHRRDFLKVLGFGVAAVSLAACDAPVRKAIPYLNKPEDVEPGIPNWYASTYAEGGDYSSILVKTREGRPVKIEGNKMSSLTRGGVSARVHASVLSLYDNEKLKNPKKGTSDISWEDLDKEVVAGLSKGGNIRIVSNTILSPTFKKVIADFIAKYPSAKHVTYDANSVSGLIQANSESFNQAVVPSYDFSKAKVMVGINADFLGTWISPDVYAAQWADTRRLSSAKGGKREMSRHFQFETGMTITGASADYRSMIKPSQEGAVVVALYNKVAAALGSAPISGPAVEVQNLDKCAKELVAAKGASIVVSGSNNPAIQTVVNALNSLLQNYGTTIDLGNPVNFRQGNDAEMNAFINEVKGGQVSTVLFLSNPVYDHIRGAELGEALGKVATSVSFAAKADETASKCKYIAPAPHYLESWGDAEPKKGFYSLMQPTISLIYNTRQAESSLLTWIGVSNDYQAYLKSNWSKNILSGGKSWVQALHDGVYEPGASATASGASFGGNLAAAASAIAAIKGSGIELSAFESIAIGTGAQANNPWLQEMPDPISKVTWENTIAISEKTAKEAGIAQGDWATLTVGGKSIELPVLIQPGQTHNTVSVAIGYGRTAAGKAGNVGANVLTLLSNGQFWANDVKLAKTKSNYTLAQTQTHNTVMGREAVIQESVLSEYVKNVKAGRFEPTIQTSEGIKRANQITLWNGHEKKNHSWGMVIDLNLCHGCGACLVSCQAENNVPVVGKAEVARAREMHWIRLDRYYSSDAPHEEGYSPSGFKAMEIASENPEVVFQPMMCQHCSNAPCETVCPVLATTHSSEGLNQMTYNRCIGTRYCANNCPYKVRRFNWFKYFENDNFDYHMNNDLGRMVLNPDVTVRSRGVIEKCSMCVQRIQAGKLVAKKEHRRPVDGEIQTACSQSCPTNAIVFGDMLDPESQISKILSVEKEGRAFHVLEEINVQPQLSYLTKIRNKEGVAKSEVKHEEHHS